MVLLPNAETIPGNDDSACCEAGHVHCAAVDGNGMTGVYFRQEEDYGGMSSFCREDGSVILSRYGACGSFLSFCRAEQCAISGPCSCTQRMAGIPWNEEGYPREGGVYVWPGWQGSLTHGCVSCLKDATASCVSVEGNGMEGVYFKREDYGGMRSFCREDGLVVLSRYGACGSFLSFCRAERCAISGPCSCTQRMAGIPWDGEGYPREGGVYVWPGWQGTLTHGCAACPKSASR